MSYTQLTQEQRYQIYALHKARFNQTRIATEIGVHKATISREVRRGRGERGYRPKRQCCENYFRTQKVRATLSQAAI